MKYMTASQAADKWNISQRRVQILCAQNRIEGVFKLGENWAIPLDAESLMLWISFADAGDFQRDLKKPVLKSVLELICGKMLRLHIRKIFRKQQF